jgi:hypothetical protein
MSEFIRFEFVSKSIATRFISNGCGFADLTDSSVWMNFGRPFIESFSNDQSNCRFLHEGKTFWPNAMSHNRVIVSLSSKYGGKVHDQGFIAATSSSICDPHPPKNATDLHVSSRTMNRIRGSAMISRRWKSRQLIPQSFLIHQIRTTIRSQGVEKCQAMVNHGLKSIDVKIIHV